MRSRYSLIAKLHAMLALMLAGMALVAIFALRFIPPGQRAQFAVGAGLIGALVLLAGLVLRFSIRKGSATPRTRTLGMPPTDD